jgi:hypothetical protein
MPPCPPANLVAHFETISEVIAIGAAGVVGREVTMLVVNQRGRIRIAGETLTGRMAELLLEHADGTRPTRAMVSEMRVLRSLKERGLIKFNRFNRPTRSVATARGRAIIGALLTSQTDTKPVN